MFRHRCVATADRRGPRSQPRKPTFASATCRHLPWPDDSFDVVTSFRGIWGTTPDAVAEAHRVLAPGGRLGITVWGHIKRSPGAWMMEPLKLATAPKVEHQAAMVALGRPGAGEELLARCGFVDIERHEIPFVAEFADPETYARAISSVGPAYEAIENVGEEEFVRSAIAVARQRVRDGLPLRAPIASVGYVARKPQRSPVRRVTAEAGDVVPRRRAAVTRRSAAVRRRPAGPRLRDEHLQALGSRSGRPRPSVRTARSRHRGRVTHLPSTRHPRHRVRLRPRRLVLLAGLGQEARRRRRRRGRRAACCAATTRRSTTPSGRSPAGPASSPAIRTRRPPPTSQSLRDAGFDDAQIFAISVFVALRIAFSTVNDALGAQPDQQLGVDAPDAVRDAVTFGRPIATSLEQPSTDAS